MIFSKAEPLNVIHCRDVWLNLTENWIYTQLRCLPGWVRSHVLCRELQNQEQFDWPSLHVQPQIAYWRFLLRYGLRTGRLRRRSAYIGRLAQRVGAQVLHSHFGFEGWVNLRAARQNSLKHVVTFYGVDVNLYPKQQPIWRERYKQLFEQVDTVLCEGEHMAECVRELGCPSAKVRVHHLGINIGKIACQPRTRRDGEPLRVLMAASFVEKKGFPLALEALGRCKDDIPLEITIIGDAKDEARSQLEKEKIIATIERYDLGSHVRMSGFQPHEIFLEQVYKHHVFLSPSITAADGDTEGGAPVSIIEAAAAGMMVVSTKHCDIPGVIRNGTTGLLAEENNIDELVEHIKWLAGHPEQWETMSRAGRRHIEAAFDADIQGEKLAAIYKDVVGYGR